MALKTFPVRVKAAEPGDSPAQAGEFEAIVSVFNNIDAVGDVVRPGAFAESLAEWKASGAPIPVYWSHRMDDPAYNIGAVLDAAELSGGDAKIPDWAPQSVKDNGGLWIKALLDTDDDASPVAAQTLRLLKEGRVRKFSFAYDILDAGWETVDGQDAFALRRLKLHETSVTQVGANDDTTLLGVKHTATEKAVRELMAAHIKRLRQAMTLLLDGPLELNEDTAGNPEPAKDEEPEGAKSEELSGVDIGTVRLLCDLGAAEVS